MPLERSPRRARAPPTTDARNRAIVEHLEAMQDQLDRTRRTVASLQALLAEPGRPAACASTPCPRRRTLAIRGTVAFEDGAEWLDGALSELHGVLDGSGIPVAGPDGALWSDAFFEAGEGAATAFVPVPGAVDDHELDVGRAGPLTILATSVAAMVHDGSFDDLDRTYAALGTVVADRGIGAPGPIREIYLGEDRCEVCWPVADMNGTAGATA